MDRYDLIKQGYSDIDANTLANQSVLVEGNMPYYWMTGVIIPGLLIVRLFVGLFAHQRDGEAGGKGEMLAEWLLLFRSNLSIFEQEKCVGA